MTFAKSAFVAVTRFFGRTGKGITDAEVTQLNLMQDKIVELQTQLNARIANEALTTIDGSAGKKACNVSGTTLIAGGTGIADLTLAAPTEGCVATIRLATLTSGTVVIKTPSGVTFNGTNNTATMDAVNDTLQLIYKAANTWEVRFNQGTVAFSTT